VRIWGLRRKWPGARTHLVAREGVEGREIIAFVIGVLLTVAGNEAVRRVGTTVVGVTGRVNRIVIGSFPRSE
jgi:hypothetical protein